MIQLRSILNVYSYKRSFENLLFPDRARFSHLGTGAAVETKADHPCTLPIEYLLISRLSFRSLWAHSSGFAVQIQVSGHAMPSPMQSDCRMKVKSSDLTVSPYREASRFCPVHSARQDLFPITRVTDRLGRSPEIYTLEQVQ